MAIVSNSPLSPLSRFQHHLRNGVGRVDGVDGVGVKPRRRDAGVTEIGSQVRDGDGSRRQSPESMPKAVTGKTLPLDACLRHRFVHDVVELRQRQPLPLALPQSDEDGNAQRVLLWRDLCPFQGGQIAP